MDVARKCLLKHIFAVSHPLPFDAVKIPNSLPVTLKICDFFKSRNARLRNFPTARIQFAPCALCANVPVSFPKTNDNNNRSTERQVGESQISLKKTE